jgi:gamma-tubulin complex component 2
MFLVTAEATSSRASSTVPRIVFRTETVHETQAPRASSSRHRDQPIPSTSSSRPSSSSSRHRSQPLSDPQDWRNRNGKQPERAVSRERVITVQVEVNGDAVEDEVERERLLDGVPLEIQEAWICEDILFVLQVGLVW